MSKKCMICNEENQDISRYCHMCGFRFAENDTETENTEEKAPTKKQKRTVYANPYYMPKRRSHRKFGSVSKNKFIFGVLLVIIVLMGCYIMKNNSSSSSQENDMKQLLLLQQMQNQSKPQMDWNFNNNTNPYFKGK